MKSDRTEEVQALKANIARNMEGATDKLDDAMDALEKALTEQAPMPPTAQDIQSLLSSWDMWDFLGSSISGPLSR